MADMPKQLPPKVQKQKTRHGKTVYYVRLEHHGKRIRLREEPFSEAWWAEYQAAMAQAPSPFSDGAAPIQPVKGNLAWLIQQHKNSNDWARLSRSTRVNRDNIFLTIIRHAGDAPYKAVDRAAVIRGRDARADRPFAAKEYLKAVRSLFRWAVANGYVRANPADGVSAPVPKTTGFHTWTEEEIEIFADHWPRS